MKEIVVPGSKSVSCRALILASLCKEKTVLKNLLDCDDTRFLQNTLQNFSVKFSQTQTELTVQPAVKFLGKNSRNFIGNAGTPARFLSALSVIVNGSFELYGVPRMHERPMKDIFEAIKKLGVKLNFREKINFLPVKFEQTQKNNLSNLPTEIEISAKTSSQFLSGLLMVGTQLPNGLKIKITDKINSRPYIQMTIDMIYAFGGKVEVSENFREFFIFNGLQSPKKFIIPVDCSSASYPIAFLACKNFATKKQSQPHNSTENYKEICIKNFAKKTYQGDEQFLEIIEKMGMKISRFPCLRNGECPGDNAMEFFDKNILENSQIQISMNKNLKNLNTIDFSTMPDVSMTAMLLASLAEGKTKFTGIETLRNKECDRILAMETNLKSLGVQISSTKNSVTIYGNSQNFQSTNLHNKKITWESFDDHRIAMIGGIIRENFLPNLNITNQKCVAKSWPDFWIELADWNEKLRAVSAMIISRKSCEQCHENFGKIKKYLIVKKPRKNNSWQFPQGGVENGEDFLGAGKRELKEECGSKLKIKNISKCLGQYKYFFPSNFSQEFQGANVHFFLAEYLSGEVEVDNQEIIEFLWIEKEKFANFFEKNYYDKIEQILQNS